MKKEVRKKLDNLVQGQTITIYMDNGEVFEGEYRFIDEENIVLSKETSLCSLGFPIDRIIALEIVPLVPTVPPKN